MVDAAFGRLPVGDGSFKGGERQPRVDTRREFLW
jgi:hypothetical protein